LALAAILLVISVVEIPLWMLLALLIRRMTEWLAELQISFWERRGASESVMRFMMLQGMGLMPFLVVLVHHNPAWFQWVMIIWAIMPAFMLYQALPLLSKFPQQLQWREFVPHLGSSGVISISVYLFRVMILLLTDKALAGLLFSAFALGGMISSIYTFAIGPSLVAKGRGESAIRAMSRVLIAVGILWLPLSALLSCSEMYHILHLDIAFSLIGGGLMIQAQHLRLKILQLDRTDTFVQDCFANILLIASIPFAVTLFGQGALVVMFAYSALLNLIYYMLPAGKVDCLSEARKVAD